ncbi:MAG: biotin--[acetyl-CoA-carboxylase] ligase [Mucinivorans sp.]
MEFNIFRFDQVTSTNDLAADLSYGHGSIVTASAQSAGRGQRGNKWESRRGENLMFSLVVCPTHIRVDEQFSLSMITALAVVDALRTAGVEALIKWPNDIYVGQRKICGILIEHSFSGPELSRTIIGVGINVAQSEFEPTAARAVSLVQLGVTGVDVEAMLGLFCSSFAALYELSFAPLALQNLGERYMANLYRGEGFFPYRDTASTEHFAARIAAIDPASGLLTLEDRSHEQRNYHFKEVEFLID